MQSSKISEFAVRSTGSSATKTLHTRGPSSIRATKLCIACPISIYLGYLWVSLLIGLPGNILIAVVYVVVRHKRTCDWFIFYLSVYDCSVCLFAVPLYLSIETGAWASTGSNLACKLEQFTIFTSQFSSVCILGIIAVDR
ncbi:orexin receptor type 2 [Plakobranchus ocellatus]|uniref:Orexin receptor type 2 n=1 Tax=Plakobranchus ocellatus TaxID=259542 RepID=A0AAV4AKS8_9GAST|nr:orexin receptor type 2 [Plakobranchus ocellatus]